MKRMMNQLVILTMIVATLVVPQPASASAQLSIIDLGTLGGTYSAGQAINQRGQIVGESLTASGEVHAFLWQDGTMTDLGTLGGTYSSARGINDLGQVVGSSTTASGELHAFLWQDGTMTDLTPLIKTFSSAQSINNRGQIVGIGEGYSFLWQHSKITDLLPGLVYDINDRSQVIGEAE